MKKILLVLATVFCVATVSAQNKIENAAQTIASQKWAAGLRVGSGLQVDAECFYSNKAYIEARFGMQWVSGLLIDFTALHNWNCFTMDWTPSVGKWFFDAGAGINVGGKAHVAYVGIAAQAKLGIQFASAPIRLSLDWTPSFGPVIGYWDSYSHASFYTNGLCNLGLSATYCF